MKFKKQRMTAWRGRSRAEKKNQVQRGVRDRVAESLVPGGSLQERIWEKRKARESRQRLEMHETGVKRKGGMISKQKGYVSIRNASVRATGGVKSET